MLTQGIVLGAGWDRRVWGPDSEIASVGGQRPRGVRDGVRRGEVARRGVPVHEN